MKLKSLSVAGFRGFNSERVIDFHSKLTLVSAPNSHGKTSIIEALEFLLYGETSKVQSADSKEEYKDSYINKHFPADAIPHIEAICLDGTGQEVRFRVEFHGPEIRRTVNDSRVEQWPFAAQLHDSARPFVVQHALKRLLLAAPSERFQGFAQLLGLGQVDAVQQAVINLCTKPESHLSADARGRLTELDLFLGRLNTSSNTGAVAKSLSKGPAATNDAFAKLHKLAEKSAGKRLDDDQIIPTLAGLRSAAAERVFAGSVAIKPLTSADQQGLALQRSKLDGFLTSDAVQVYGRVATRSVTDRLGKELQLLGLGLELVSESPEQCPLCQQSISETHRTGMHERHLVLDEQLREEENIGAARTDLAHRFKELGRAVQHHAALELARGTDLINANSPEASKKITALFGKGHSQELMLVAGAGAALKPKHRVLDEAAQKVSASIQVCADAVNARSEDLSQIEALVQAVAAYVGSADAYEAIAREVEPTLADPTRLLQKAIDAEAGTAELSLIIETFTSRDRISKAVRVRALVDGLKDLKKLVEQAVGQTMEDAFASELTGAVMTWYERIRTTGDPDVHFSGFEMEKTKGGSFKNRRVRVGARSYGVELASAVSSLSESKLNALGLCMSIATALRAPGPWGFLVLDDPIQSWDDDHEFQFIDIVRRLAEQEDKQIVLMSHRDSWVDQVATGCRSLNGLRYHITAYNQDGPLLSAEQWAPVEERLKTILSIAGDASASRVRLQEAEAEVRLAACQLAVELAQRKLKRSVSGHTLNSQKVRAILTDAACPSTLADRVVSTFETTDDAHHSGDDYDPNRERIRRYHGVLSDLKTWIRA